MRWMYVSALFLQGGMLAAATLTWQGTTSSMNAEANWSPQQKPVNNDDLIFPASSTFIKSVQNDITGGTLTLGDLTISSDYVFTGGTFVIPADTHALTYGASGSNINVGMITLTGTWQVTGVGATPGNEIRSNISGEGNLEINGSYLLLSGINTYTGTTTLGTGATLKVGSGTALSASSNISLANGATLDLSGVTAGAGFNATVGVLTGTAASTITLGNGSIAITNSGSVIYPGTIEAGGAFGGGVILHASSSGSLTLSGNNSYSSATHPGLTTVNAGTLIAGAANAFATDSNLTVAEDATINLNDFDVTFGTIAGAGTIALGAGTITCAQGGTFTGDISGTGGVTLTASTLTLSGTLTYSGQTQISGGSSFVTNSLGSSSALLFLTGGGTVKANTSGFTFNNPVTLSANGAFDTNGQTITLGGAISGAGSLSKAGSGTLVLGGANAYTGATNIQAGTLRAASATALGTNSFCSLSSSSSVLDLNDEDITIGSLNGVVSSSVTLGSGTLTISSGSTDDAFYGVISGTGGLTAAGGTITLMKPNTYTGTTTIQEGATLNIIDLGDTDALIFSTAGGNLEFGSASSSAAPITINGPASIGSNTFEITLSGAISGEAGVPFTKLGPGTLTLSGANTLESQIAIEGGTLNLNSDSLGTATEILFNVFGGTLQAGSDLTITTAVNLSAPGTIDTNGHAVEISGAVITNNPFTKTGEGTLTLSGANTYQARTTIAGGTLVASSTSLPIGTQIVFQGSGDSTFTASSAFTPMTSSIVLMADGTINTNSNNVTITGVVAGLAANALTKSGAGILTLSGANIYEGATNVTVGTVQAGVATGSDSGAFGINSPVTVSAAATLSLNTFNNAIKSLTGASGSFVTLGTATLTINDGDDKTFAGNISGTGGSIVLTTGTAIFSGTNSYTGSTTVNGGTLQAGSTSAYAPASHFIVGSGATLNLNNFSNTVGSLSGSGSVELGSATLTLANGNSQTFSGNISGTGGVTLTTGTATFSGTNVYSGATTLTAGTMRAGSTGALSADSAFTVAADATLFLNGFNNTVKSITGAGAITLGSGTLTVATGSNLTFSGDISGEGGIALTSGTWTLSGTNTYGGATAVNGGTLLAGSTTAFGTSAIAVASGAALDFQTFANSAGAITNSGEISSSATITATSFTQDSGGTTTFDFPTDESTPVGNVSTTGAINLDGTLVVTDTGGFAPAETTQVILFQSSGSGKQLQGTFSSATLAFGKLSYDYSDNHVVLSLSGGCDGIWSATTDGNWAAVGNWTGCAPGVSGVADNNDTATFPTVAASAVTVTLANADGSTAQDVTLHTLTFDSATTSYTIEHFNGAGTISLDAAVMSTKPTIAVLAGDHTINAEISLEQDARFTLHTGSLTLGEEASITSTGTWNVSEGAGSGVLNNYGSITPSNLLLEGNTINNHGTISPSESFEISGLGGIGSPATLNNYGTLSAGTTCTIGGAAGPTIFNNYGTASSSSTLTITSGTVTNASNATLGTSEANMVFTAGTLANSGLIRANTYTQSSGGTLQTTVLSQTTFGKVTVTDTAAINGSLIVTALPGTSLTDGDTVDFITAASRSGTFANVSFQNFPGELIPSIVYLANGVQLDIREASAAPAHGSAVTIAFTSINQHNSFITLKAFQMRNRIVVQNDSFEALAADPCQLTASSDDSFLFAQHLNPERRQKTQQLADRIAQGKAIPWSVYAGPISSFGSVDTKGKQIGLGYASAGALAGFDRVLDGSPSDAVWAGCGALLEYRKIWSTMHDNWGSASVDRIHGSFYTTVIPKGAPALAFEGILGFAYNWEKIKRSAGINQQRTATGRTASIIGDALLGVECTFSSRTCSWMPKSFSFTPLMTWQYIIDHIRGYTETGAGMYNLKVSSYTPKSLTSVLGTRLDWFFYGRRTDLQIELQAGWQYEYLDRSLSIGLNAFNATGLSTVVTTEAPGRSSLLTSLDFLFTFRKGWQLEMNGSYQLNSLFYDAFFYLGFGREF